MSFYDLPKIERAQLVASMTSAIAGELERGKWKSFLLYAEDEDTYIRKSAYLALGRIYFNSVKLRNIILEALDFLLAHENFKVRQTVINAAGEIGKKDFEIVRHIFDKGLLDQHHSPRNAVIGSIKKMGEVNPKPVLKWARLYLHHPDHEIRREICHGIELRGRKHPEDILPLLKELQHDGKSRVRNTLVHVIGQIAYKPGCIETVIKDLKTWENKELVSDALEEIIDVHHRYRNFSALSQTEAINYIRLHYPVTSKK